MENSLGFKPGPFAYTMLAIDPGTRESGWCKFDAVSGRIVRILDFGKCKNESVLGQITGSVDLVIVEKLISYGKNVGNDVLETCEWVGRFTQYANDKHIPVGYIRRIDERRSLCGSPTANDSMIRNALIAKYAKHDLKNGKGTKDNPDFFYGFKADMWQAFAIGETYLKMWGEADGE